MPPNGSELLAVILKPFGYALGLVRTLTVLALGVLYVVLNGLSGLLVSLCALLNPQLCVDELRH